MDKCQNHFVLRANPEVSSYTLYYPTHWRIRTYTHWRMAIPTNSNNLHGGLNHLKDFFSTSIGEHTGLWTRSIDQGEDATQLLAGEEGK